MTQSAPARRAQFPSARTATRTISALMLREMSTTYGRSALGYLWAILEPVGGILLLTVIFSIAFRSPSLGTSFPLFYATGFLPFTAYFDIQQKVGTSLRFSKPLLYYPRVSFIDAILARFLVNGLTQLMISFIVLSAIFIFSGTDLLLKPAAIANGFAMALALALGIGTLNCYLLSVFPLWERLWSILNRPLFIVSGVFFTLESVPMPFRDWLWWNPLVHMIGEVRRGIYATYDGAYVSSIYVYGISTLCFATGLLLLRRYNRDIANR